MAQKMNSLKSVGFLLLALSGFCFAAQNPCQWTGVEKIIAVGDLHGDYESFILILKDPKVGLVDDNLHWIGGRTHFVQTGDIMNRGDRAKDILDLLMRLEKEAEAAGGKVHILLGNHEEATITGISLGYPDYVSPKEFVSFLPEDFRKAREGEYLSGLPDVQKIQAQFLGEDLDKNPILLNFWTDVLINIRKRIDPEAALAYIDSFNKTYGKWLLQKNSIIKINDIVFVHGGINLEYSSWKLEDINEVLRLEMGAYALHPINPQIAGHPFTPKLVYNPQGPLWYRQDDVTSQTEIDKILANLGAGRMVVGHNFLGAGVRSPVVLQEDAVARFENKVWMIDTGIGYRDLGGILYALIIEDGKFNFYASLPEPSAQSPEENPIGEGPKTPEEIEEFLKMSIIQVIIHGSAGRTDPWKVKLASNGATRWAHFKYINRPRPEPIPDSFQYEIAAYELDKYLGLDFVPPVVRRTIRDTVGSLQIFVENAIRESDRKREDFLPDAQEAFSRAMADLKVFENLVYAACGNEIDTLIQKETGKINRVDFSEAFAPEDGTIPGCEIVRCSRRFYQTLCSWDREKVTTLLAPYLNQEEIRALHARQGSIVRMIQTQIEKHGESAVLF